MEHRMVWIHRFKTLTMIIKINKEKEAKSLISKFSLSLLKESETEGPPPYLSVRKKKLCVWCTYIGFVSFYIFLLFRTQTKPPLIYFCVCGSFSVTKSKSKTIFYCNNFFWASFIQINDHVSSYTHHIHQDH